MADHPVSQEFLEQVQEERGKAEREVERLRAVIIRARADLSATLDERNRLRVELDDAQGCMANSALLIESLRAELASTKETLATELAHGQEQSADLRKAHGQRDALLSAIKDLRAKLRKTPGQLSENVKLALCWVLGIADRIREHEARSDA